MKVVPYACVESNGNWTFGSISEAYQTDGNWLLVKNSDRDWYVIPAKLKDYGFRVKSPDYKPARKYTFEFLFIQTGAPYLTFDFFVNFTPKRLLKIKPIDPATSDLNRVKPRQLRVL